MRQAPSFVDADTAKPTSTPVPQTPACTVDPGKPLIIINWGKEDIVQGVSIRALGSAKRREEG